MTDISLATQFPQFTEADWLAAVERALRGKPASSLDWKTLDGINVKPLYGQSAKSLRIERRQPAGEPWIVTQRVDMPRPGAANAQALEDLANGATGLAVVLPGAVSAGSHGVAIRSSGDLQRLFAGIHLDYMFVRLDGGARAPDSARQLVSLYAAENMDFSRCLLSLCVDPIGATALSGHGPGEDTARRALADLVKELTDKGARGGMLAADGRVFHGAGASEAQELAAMLATAVQYLRWLEAEGIPPGRAFGHIEFVVSADADQFATIAKLRALRQLWRQVQSACGQDCTPTVIHAETSMRMISRQDPHVNILRACVAAFSAGAGGADSVTVLPFTSALGLPDAFARRMARNTQSIILEESGIGRVTDPLAGSGFGEHMTGELAVRAWALFQEIETQGGMMAALDSGFIQDRVAETASVRAKALGSRKTGLTGVSEFPNLSEPPVCVLDMHLADDTADLAAADSEVAIQPLVQARLAQPYERLRDAARANGQPSVFIAEMGTPAAFSARSNWLRNLCAAGGIAAPATGGFLTAKDAADAFANAGLEIAIIASSDAVYADLANETARALKSAGARIVGVAGNADTFEDRGAVDRFIAAGCDAITELSWLHGELGIAKKRGGS